MYTAVLTWLPGAPSLFHPTVTQRVMEALGTWHPHVVKSMLPVLLALVVVSSRRGGWPFLELFSGTYNLTISMVCCLLSLPMV